MVALSVTVTVGAFVLGLAVPPQDAKLKQPAAAGKTPPLVFISMLLPALPVWLGLFASCLFVGVLRWERILWVMGEGGREGASPLLSYHNRPPLRESKVGNLEYVKHMNNEGRYR